MSSIKFSNFMNSWLYDDDGYYAKYKSIGKDGDFFTSVSSSMFFGGSIANRLLTNIENGFLPEDTTIVEIGAHKGYLTADVIQFIYTLKPKLLDKLKFVIVERFSSLQKEQQDYINSSFNNRVCIEHISDVNELDLDNGFIIANEIFDSFPCELLYKGNQIAHIDSNFHIAFENLNSDKSSEHICKVRDRYNIQKGEISLGYEEFARELKSGVGRFEFVTFDYGDRAPRPDFSIRIYKKHKTFPLFEEELKISSMYKTSDITYDVNFTHLIDSFEDLGIKCESYKTQANALIDFGILSLIEQLKNNVSTKIYDSELSRVKTLISPSFLGDRFKMCRFVKE